MAIDDELKAQIPRCHFAKHWRVGTIACQRGVHHSTVERVLGEAGVEREHQRSRRPSKLDPYMAFITQTLECFPTLTAARLFDMAKARGYTGGSDHFRHRIARLPVPSPIPAPYCVPAATPPGRGRRLPARRSRLAVSLAHQRHRPCAGYPPSLQPHQQGRRRQVPVPRPAELLHHRRRTRTDAALLPHQAPRQSHPPKRCHRRLRRRLDRSSSTRLRPITARSDRAIPAASLNASSPLRPCSAA